MVAFFTAPAAFADELSDTGEFLDGVAAVVNDGLVLKSEFRRQVANVKQRAQSQGLQLPPESTLNDQILEQLIVTEIQLQRADRIGLRAEISDLVLNQAIARIGAEQGIPFERMPEWIEQQEGISYREFREKLREELMMDRLRTIEVLFRIQVSDREIEQCIADLETNVVVNSDWQLSHILLSIGEGASAEDVAATEALADDIHAQLQGGTDFRELAALHSKGPTALEGGALGWMNGQQVPSIFTDVLQDMQAGDVSEPFRTSSSIHIVKVDDLRSAVERSEVDETKIRHILIMLDEIIDDATAQQRLNEALEKIRAGADFGEQAKLLSDDPGSANQGGDLGWSELSIFDPAFAAQAEAAEIGEITEPFRTQYGWHILEVLDRRVYDNTEELKENNCANRIRASKREEETVLWLQRMRDEAYVDKRI